MHFLRFVTASMITLSSVGCCCCRSGVMDSCDPCGQYIQPRMSISQLWSGSRGFGCGGHHSCGSCGCESNGMIMDSGCASGGCGAPSDNYMAAMPSSSGSSGCACGKTASSTPTMMSAPIPPYSSAPGTINQSISPTINPHSDPTPLPPEEGGGAPTTMLPPRSPGSPQMQHVSYEEFQRMPGTVISGPGAVASTGSIIPSGQTNSTNIGQSPTQQASATTQPFLAPPPPLTQSSGNRPKFQSVSRQATWFPAKGY